MPKLAAFHEDALASSSTLILGGTSGIGAAVSSAVLANSGKVFISSSSESNISTAVKHLQSTYPGATIAGAAADLSNQDTIEANLKGVFDAAVKELGGPLDHIVYCAGDGLQQPGIATIEAKDAFAGWTVRYQGPLMVGKLVAAYPGVYLKRAGSSSITYTSGILGHRPMPGVVSAMIGATEALSRSLAIQFAPIRVNTIIPGAINTELLEKFGPQMLEVFKEKSLVKAVGKPQDIAEAYLFLMRCAFMTAQEITVDGGYTYV